MTINPIQAIQREDDPNDGEHPQPVEDEAGADGGPADDGENESADDDESSDGDGSDDENRGEGDTGNHVAVDEGANADDDGLDSPTLILGGGADVGNAAVADAATSDDEEDGGSSTACSDDEKDPNDEAPNAPCGSNGDDGISVCLRFGAGSMCDGRGCPPCYEALHVTPAQKRRRLEELAETPEKEPESKEPMKSKVHATRRNLFVCMCAGGN